MEQAPSRDSYNDEGRGIPLIAGASDLGSLNPKPSRFTTSPTRLSQLGDIILCVRAIIGDINWSDGEYSYGRGVAGIRVDEQKVDPSFVFYWLQSNADSLRSLGRGATFTQISKTDITDFPIPSLSEQQRVVSFIKECIKRLDEIRLLQDDASKEAGSLFEAFVEAQIEPDWTWQQVSEITTEVRNGWSWKESHTGQLIQVLRLSAVRTLSLDLSEVRTVFLEIKQSEEFSLKKDDVFMVRGNSPNHLVGRSAISTDDYPTVVFNDLLIRLRFTPEMLPEFANFMLHSRKVREQIERTAKTAAGIWKINQTGIRSLKIPCPPISIQKEKLAALQEGLVALRQIVQHFTQTDTKALSVAILRKAFAGEL